ncbi:MAG: VWA domain-containing protein [Candidatus Omnitrophica bacterium]|nr:VWA domain-containing protein [Candidatus Omnitrophota bacterium]
MRFGNIEIVYLLIWLVPILAVFMLWSAKKRAKVTARFAQKELLGLITVPCHTRSIAALNFMDLAVVLLLILAAGGPRWGYEWKDEKAAGTDVVFAVDVSRSMLAADITPDRLSFAKEELADLVKKTKNDRAGLIAFAGEAFLQCPLTEDKKGFLLALRDLSPGSVSKGGTNLALAIEEALRSYSGAGSGNKRLVIITDGESTEGDVNEALKDAVKHGVIISCVGIGTPSGELISVIDAKGQKTYVKDPQGNPVKSRLMEDALKNVAERTGGIYVRADKSSLGLEKIYAKWSGSAKEKVPGEERRVKVLKERYRIPLAAVFLILLWRCLKEAWFASKKS